MVVLLTPVVHKELEEAKVIKVQPMVIKALLVHKVLQDRKVRLMELKEHREHKVALVLVIKVIKVLLVLRVLLV